MAAAARQNAHLAAMLDRRARRARVDARIRDVPASCACGWRYAPTGRARWVRIARRPCPWHGDLT